MESLELRNIRTFINSGPVKIAPITILVGQNSSGKSTFARFLPLLKQGAESRTREPILWLGRSVDFGSADEAISKFSNKESLGFSIELKIATSALDGRRRVLHSEEQRQQESPIKIDVDYVFTHGQLEKYKYNFAFKGHAIYIEIDPDGVLCAFKVNDSDRTDFVIQNKLTVNWTGAVPTVERVDSETQPNRSAYAEILRFIKPYLDGRTKSERVHQLARSLINLPSDKIASRAHIAFGGDAYWKRVVGQWKEDSPKTKQLTELILIYQFFSETLDSIALHTRLMFYRIQYITPIRARAERYYRLQGLSIDEIDADGENVAMYLHNLSIDERDTFEQWMLEFFGVCISTRPSTGHVSLILVDHKHPEQEFNLADTGFGFSQLIPIMIQLWKIGREPAKRRSGTAAIKVPTIFAIEQPELHLHPKLQAKLVDVFISAIQAANLVGIDLRLVIETHSEQIISALGLKVARKEIPSSAINIAIFEKENLNTATLVKGVEFNENGIVKHWPIGFFDSAI